MSDLFNKLNQLGKQAARNQASSRNGSANSDLGDVLGDLLGGLFGGATPVKQQPAASNLSAGQGAALLGGTAGLAAMAYKMFQKWQAGSTSASSQSPWGNSNQNTYQYQNQSAGRIGSDPFSEYNQTQATQRASVEQRNEMGRLILRAMIFAARADGHIDDKEQAMIMSATQQLNYEPNINNLIREYLNEPLNPQTLARNVRTKDQAFDIYRLSAAAIVADHPQEQQYLADLARVLGIDTNTKRQLDQEASLIRRQVTR